ncbi:MAG TPA: cupin domain-containing protein [Candidatus Acidoferrum sp.]|nr:cupin domain-containing protein [Candidatus Acidoferrum sp.]
MNDRREFIQLAALVALAAPVAAHAADATPAPKPRGEIARYPLSGDLAGKEAVLVELGARPGVANGAGAHRHPGFVLGYVVEGAYAFGVNNETPHIVHAGETFFEDKGALHSGNGSADPDKPARLLAFMVVPAGDKLVMPA